MDTNDSNKIFREKLGNYAAEPDPHVWERIRHSLNKKQRRRLVPLWLPLGAAVAVLLLALWFSDTFSEPALNEFPVTETEQAPGERPSDTAPATEARPGSAIPGADDARVTGADPDGSPPSPGSQAIPVRQGAGVVAASNPEQAPTDAGEKTTAGDNRQGQPVPAPALRAEPSNAVAQSADSQPENGVGSIRGNAAEEAIPDPSDNARVASGTALADSGAEPADSGKKSLFDVLEEQETAPAVEVQKARWSMGPSIAPVYYNSFGNGSPIASTFMENSKSGTVNLSYGLSVAYEVSDRLSLRSGIHKVDFGYNTNQVSFTSTVAARPSSLIRTISYSDNSKNVVVHSTLGPASPAQQEGAALDVTAPSPQREGRMLQQFGYLEVPFELQYTLIDRQWGLNLIGGMSSLFLIDNSVSLDSAGTSTEIGEASNMNALNFSTNLGIGVFYSLTPRWQLQLQPMVKMHLNTFNETAGSFRPYTVGVYSGMIFRF